MVKGMLPRGLVVAVLALSFACSTEAEEPSAQEPATGGAGGMKATGGAPSTGGAPVATGGNDAGCGDPGQAGAAGASGVPQEVGTGACLSWEGRACADAADEPLQIRVEVDGVLDAVLDAPGDDECSPDVFFFWDTCIGLRPAVLARSTAGEAALDLQLRHRHRCVETPHLELEFGEYRDSSGGTWRLEELPDEPYAVPVPRGRSSGRILDLTQRYAGHDGEGNEVELRIHAVACAAYYPCLR